jgi:hypothetical protein
MHSLNPLGLGIGVTVLGYGMIYHNFLIAIGVAMIIFGIIGWVNEYVAPEAVESLKAEG